MMSLAHAFPLAVGKQAPELVLPLLSGEKTQFKLSSQNGKVVILHFWATWCSGCKREMPVLSRFLKNHSANKNKVSVLAISIEKSRERKEVISQHPFYDFPLGLLADATVNDFPEVSLIPLTVVIDPQQKVAAIFSPNGIEAEGLKPKDLEKKRESRDTVNGELTEERLNQVVDPFLSKSG